MTKAEWEDWKDENRGDICTLKNFATKNDICCLDDIISSYDVDYIVRERLKNGGWQGVACCIYNIINNLNDDWYEIDGYENLTTCTDWDTYARYVEDEMVFDPPTCDRCGDEYEEDDLKLVNDWIVDLKGNLLITDKEIEKLKECSFGKICESCFKETLTKVRKELGE